MRTRVRVMGRQKEGGGGVSDQPDVSSVGGEGEQRTNEQRCSSAAVLTCTSRDHLWPGCHAIVTALLTCQLPRAGIEPTMRSSWP